MTESLVIKKDNFEDFYDILEEIGRWEESAISILEFLWA